MITNQILIKTRGVKVMRHIVVRGIMGLVWIGVGVFGLLTGKGESSIFSILIGAAFCYSSFSMWKKSREDNK